MLKQFCVLYLTTLCIMTVMDVIWLKMIMQHLFKAQVGELAELRMVPAAIFYLLYPLGVVLFASQGAQDWQGALLYGCALGVLCYGTYDVTNLATLRPWTVQFTVIDIAWGGVVTGVSSVVGWWATRALLH